MKSSGSVLSRQNPVPAASTAKKSHCHPSRKESLSKKERKPTSSPVRLNQKSQLQSLSHGSQRLHTAPGSSSGAAAEGQPYYTEIWPSNDGESLSGNNTGALEQSAKSEDSVLAKYIDRFRHGRPCSREERREMTSVIGEEQVPFWWTSHPSALSSTSTKTSDENVHDVGPADRLQQDRFRNVLSDTSQSEYDDTEILHLQERASRLLRGSECELSDESVLVSLEGLGCSDFSSPVTVDEPIRQPLIPSLIKPATGKVSIDAVHTVSFQKSLTPALAPPTRPEEDILFQWRLRRKMEQARDMPQSYQRPSLHGSALSWQNPISAFPSASGQANKQQTSTRPSQFSQRDAHPLIPAPQPETTEAPTWCPPPPSPSLFPNYVLPGSSLSQPQAISHVPAHMHLLCDVLPCSVQSSHSRENQSISRRSEESQTKCVHKKTQVSEASLNVFSEEPAPSSHHASPGTTVEEQSGQDKVFRKKRKNGETKDSEKKTSVPIRQERRAARSFSQESLSNKATVWSKQKQRGGSQKSHTTSCTGVGDLRASPVHTALGQVVSEVLFPTADSSPPQKVPVSSVSPSLTVASSSTSTLPTCNAKDSMEVISLLLREAEDSDGKEFEDDPLLTVLRQQRKWVKDQIREVDSILKESLTEQKVTSKLTNN